jgi:hypothetical protein
VKLRFVGMVFLAGCGGAPFTAASDIGPSVTASPTAEAGGFAQDDVSRETGVETDADVSLDSTNPLTPEAGPVSGLVDSPSTPVDSGVLEVSESSQTVESSAPSCAVSSCPKACNITVGHQACCTPAGACGCQGTIPTLGACATLDAGQVADVVVVEAGD